MSSNEKTIILPVDVGNEELIHLQITQEKYDRALKDSAYLRTLIDEALGNNKENNYETSNVPVREEPLPLSTSRVHRAEVFNEDSSKFIWTTPNIQLLLALYEEYEQDFSVGTKRHGKIWEEIALKIRATNPQFNMTGSQCQSKLSGLKKTYKKIIDHNSTSGNDRKTWPFFDRMDEIFGKTGWVQARAIATDAGPSSSSSDTKDEDDPPKIIQKKRKIDETDFLNHFKSISAKKQQYRAEKDAEKEKKFERLLRIKEKHHEEKLKILQLFLNPK